ncbi:MAG: hypothetical protein FWC09_03365 [Lachnospiraceae bacterium]|nr:hypothetical protein [Lachnospiraceae bacterium]
MGYAVVGYFDEVSDRIIKSLWHGMADSDICDYLISSDNNPHIKFAMYNELEIEIIKDSLMLLTKQINKIPLHFKTFSFYPNDKPFICIDVAVSIPILTLHEKVQTAFEKYALSDNNVYFRQGIWKPDCQLTLPLDKLKLVNAINYLSEMKLPFNGILEQIGLIEFHPAKQLFSYELL